MRTGLFDPRRHLMDRHESLREQFVFALVDGYHVIDADTVLVIRDIGSGWFNVTSVRILGIDAPELRGSSKLEKQTAELLAEVVRRWCHMVSQLGTLAVDSEKSDRYAGRVLGDLVDETNGRKLSSYLLNAKLVRSYAGDEARNPWKTSELKTVCQRAEHVLTTLGDNEPDRRWVIPAIVKFVDKHGAEA